MNKYAVIRLAGRQYKLSEGEEFLAGKASDKVHADVLLIVDGDKVEVGKPVLSAKVGLKVLEEEEKGKKIDVLKYKSKSRYRKHIGFRPVYTRIKVQKIS